LRQSATAQFPSNPGFNQAHVERSLILYSPDALRNRLIKPGDTICYKTGLNDTIFRCNKIEKISSDTVFFTNGFLKTSAIRALKATWHDNVVDYDLQKWAIIAPPPEAFNSLATFNAFKRWLEENVKTDGTYSLSDWWASDLYMNNKNRNSFSRRSAPGILYFQDTTNLSYCMIRVRDYLHFTTKNDDAEHSGLISWINRDTIFLKNQRYLAGELKEITRSKLGIPSFPVYRSRIILPPPGDDWSPFTRNQYIHDTKHKLDKDHSKINSDTIHFHFLKVNITRLPLLVLALAYERKISRNVSFETEMSCQFQVINDTTAEDLIPYMYPLYRYTGFTVIPGFKFYSNYSSYIEPILVYRYLTMRWSNSIFPQWSDDPVQSQYRNDIALGVRFGKMKNFNGLIFDGYIGFGLQYIFIHQLSYGVVDKGKTKISWFRNDHSPRVQDIAFPYPLFNLGIKLGFGW
jgi:hypothetical protein